MAISTADNQAGFTLVEILCVLALLGLTAGLVVLNLPKPPPPFKTEVSRLTTFLNLASRESIIDGKSRGIDFTASGAEISTYDGDWLLEGEQPFTHVLGIGLTVEDQLIDVENRTREKAKENADVPPIIYFDATGGVTPFVLSLNGRDKSYNILPDLRGKIIMEETP